ncbi:MAG: type-F conjugative transfer system secretin TraK [Alphaproteobacteria bacterium]
MATAVSILVLAGAPQVVAQSAKDQQPKSIALPAVSADADPRRAKPGTAERVQFADTLQKITVEPGVNEIIQIAEGHPNRIVTPFEEPRIVTTAAASVETSENVIYVAPANAGLITMFLTETGDESVSISLTLQPKKIPPRELRLDLPPGVLVPKADDAAPGLDRTARPENGRAYVARAGEVFDQLAQGRVPGDFAFSQQASPPYPLCTAENGFEVSFSTGQYLLGQRQEVYVGVVRNGGPATASFQEPWCYSEGVIAVALWPHATLQPGEYAEIYLARAVVDPAEFDPRAPRPSLLQARRQ